MTTRSLHSNADTPWLDRQLSRAVPITWELVIYLMIFILAVFTRFYQLGDRVMSHDESLHTRYSYNLSSEGNFQHTPMMHGPILFHMTALSYTLFGDNDFTSRIYTSVLGVFMVMSPLLFRRWLGRWGTILACVMILISPLLLYYNRYIRHDTPSMSYALLMLWGIMMYLSGPENQKRRAHWLYVIAASMILNLGSKETAFIYIAIFGVFLALYWFVRLGQAYWRIPGKPVFQFVVMGTLFGGVLAIGMYIILDVIKFDLISGPDGVLFAQLSNSDQITYLIWTAAAVIVVLAIILGPLLWAYQNGGRIRAGQVMLVLGLMFLAAFAFVVVEEVSHTTPTSEMPIAPSDPTQAEEAAIITGSMRTWPMVLVWLLAIGTLAFLYVVRRRPDDEETDEEGNPKRKRGQGFWGILDAFPEVDVMMVIGTLILPWATALVPYLMRGTPAELINFANSLPAPITSIVQSVPQINTPQQTGQVMLHFLAWIPLMAISVALGLAWNWRRWLVAASVFYSIFAFFFTTVFTNIAGLASGMIYSLGYWLEQQGVRRGSQPQYYYLLIIMPFYEFLPVIGSLLAMLAGSVLFWRNTRKVNELEAEFAQASAQEEVANGGAGADASGEGQQAIGDQNRRPSAEIWEELDEKLTLKELPFLLFVAWLAVLNLIGYSLAGEKMPWLGTHLTLPMIFLTAWFFGRIVGRIDWTLLRQRGWIALLLLIVGSITVAQVIGTLVVGRGPFMGLSNDQLQQTYSWIASLLVTVAVVAGLLRLSAHIGVKHIRQLTAVAAFVILGGLTFRSAWMASFINYDYATEYLVYAHAAPAIKTVLNQITDLSYRITDAKDLRFAYDDSVPWPYSWYFRDFRNAVYIGSTPTVQNLQDALVIVVGDDKRGRIEPILEDRYQRFEYIRLWWPMQDYFNLTIARVNNLLDFAPENQNAAQIRQGMFDIWWNRDYTTYGNAVGRNFDTARWPVSDSMLVYVRKDIAAQVWNYGTGEGAVFNPLTSLEENLCNINRLEVLPERIYQAPIPMNRPLGLALDAEGRIYVAEEFGHRISVFNADGTYATSIGQQGNLSEDSLALFNRPNSLTIGVDGRILVADTWNYRIQEITSDGQQILSWGQPGEFGFGAPALPTDSFWGPRDVKVGNDGRIYVSDTGNKRIRVYTIENGGAVYQFDIATGGSAPGELNEPSGIALHPDGRIFIADTWNRRVAVFASNGAFLNNIAVRAWYEEKGNRPYLAIDAEHDLLYVTDPDGGRVLIYDTEGNCLGSFGQPIGDLSQGVQFNTVGGIAVDGQGNVYIADAGAGVVYRFARPYNQVQESIEIPGAESTEESTAETTAE